MENNKPRAEQTQQFVTEVPEGKFYNTIHTSRNVKIYSVTQSELNSLSWLNFFKSLFFSIGAFLSSSSLTLWLQSLAGSPSKELSRGIVLLIIILLVLSISSFGLGIFLGSRRKSELSSILSETEIN